MNAREQFRFNAKAKLDDSSAKIAPLNSGDKLKDQARATRLEEKIGVLQDRFYINHTHKLLIILQGMDTSGKDGTIRTVFKHIDPLGIRSVPFKVPTPAEQAHDFLWRIHQQVPGKGEIVIFNRSHYEDVVITKVHGWIDDDECKRRYAHIRHFERMLAETGTVIVKLFLHISKDEQKSRLQKRLDNPHKQWKFDPQDIEERKHWGAYQQAYEKAMRETDMDHAPWYVIPADSKKHRNLAVASIVLEALTQLNLTYPPPRPELAQIKIDE
jgi:PPK2 family polyphosphate:nucleotide phosphotransferase